MNLAFSTNAFGLMFIRDSVVYTQTYIHTHKTTTVTLAVHVRRGLIMVLPIPTFTLVLQSHAIIQFIYKSALLNLCIASQFS